MAENIEIDTKLVHLHLEDIEDPKAREQAKVNVCNTLHFAAYNLRDELVKKQTDMSLNKVYIRGYEDAVKECLNIFFGIRAALDEPQQEKGDQE